MERSLTIVVGDERVHVADSGPATVGRGEDVEVLVPDPRVSRRHGIIRASEDGWVYEDAGSRHGSYVDGARIRSVRLTPETVVRLADPRSGPALRFGPAGRPAESVEAPLASPDGAPTRRSVRIGRAEDCDLVVPEPLVSRHHAEVRPLRGGRWEVADLDSTNGTFVDGRRVTRAGLGEGQELRVGRAAFRLDGGHLRPVDPSAPVLRAAGLTVSVGGQRILDGVSFDLEPDTLLAMVGPTGSGKTTLLRALTGFRPPDEGEVLVGGHDLYAEFDLLRHEIGYVPQENIVHRPISVRRALRYAAELRFPPDSTRRERAARVEEVMERLGIAERASVAVERISGGQRKRTNVAIELLTKPGLLFLDEPTSGLDPGFERTIMETLRDIASDGRAVVVVTHSVASLDLCDRVLVLDANGRLAYDGPPSEIEGHFGTGDFVEVFRGLDPEAGGRDVRPVPEAAEPKRPAPPLPAPAEIPPTPQIGWLRQLWMLVRRQLAIIAADRRNWLYLLAELLIPAVLIRAVAGSHALQPGTEEVVRNSRVLLGAVAVGAAVVGTANAVREIRKEMPIYLRERSVGLRRSAYLLSKMLVLGAITALQVAALTAIATRSSGGPTRSLLLQPPLAELIADVALAGVAAVALGLMISAFVSSPEKAMALVPVIFLVEWLFSGVAIPLEGKPVLRQLSHATSANWGVAAEAASVDLCSIARLPDPAKVPATARDRGSVPTCDWRWKHRTSTWAVSVAAMGGLTLAALFLAGWALARQEPGGGRRARRRGRRRRDGDANASPPARAGPEEETSVWSGGAPS